MEVHFGDHPMIKAMLSKLFSRNLGGEAKFSSIDHPEISWCCRSIAVGELCCVNLKWGSKAI